MIWGKHVVEKTLRMKKANFHILSDFTSGQRASQNYMPQMFLLEKYAGCI
jgi:hypothetical protein